MSADATSKALIHKVAKRKTIPTGDPTHSLLAEHIIGAIGFSASSFCRVEFQQDNHTFQGKWKSLEKHGKTMKTCFACGPFVIDS